MAGLKRDDVRSLLTPEMVAADAGISVRPAGTQVRAPWCPGCGPRSGNHVVIARVGGAWHCKVCGAAGDIFDLVAGWNGLDAKRDFPRVLARAASIAGVIEGSADPEVERRRVTYLRAEQERAEVERAERARAIAEAPATWDRCSRSSAVGEAYLATVRGIEPAPLIQRGVLRFTAAGDPAIALYDLATGGVINVVVRRREPGDGPKTPGLYRCPTAGTFGMRIDEVTKASIKVVVLVEGVADTLAAMLAFPTAGVIGAHGAGNLPRVVAAAAPAVNAMGGRLLVVPHVDGGTGERYAAEAVVAAQRAGLTLDETIDLVDVRPAKDLADAWRAGWRPLP